MFSDKEAFILGTIQGLTEFLPVSSSAHLAIIPWMFKWDDPGLSFDVALHLGTLLALLIYYWRDWLEMVAAVFRGGERQRRLLGFLIVASIPGALFGLLFEKQAETVFRSPILIATAMSVLGTLLWLFDYMMRQRRTMGDMTMVDATLIGISQAFALIPGVSRSGVTITVGRALGLNREDAANFSFLMATPIIAGAGILKAHELLRNGLDSTLTAGFLASAVFGLLAISALVHFVRTRTYRPFAWYRILFAVAVVTLYVHRA